jgi:ABC-2 type transport system permease protein
MSDLRTMIWKEWNDFLGSGGRYDFFRPLLVIALLGIVFPLTFEQRWMELDSAAVLIILYTPFMLIISFIGDAIAGERERHTLETLLASRISDRAILLGKVLVAVGFNWGLTLFCLLLGAAVVNLSQGNDPWSFYTPINLFVTVLIMSLLTNLLAASGGVLISLKSATVRQAGQTMILGMIVLGLGVYGITRIIPASAAASLTTPQIVLIIMGALALLDVILLAAALLSFQRSRLIESS